MMRSLRCRLIVGMLVGMAVLLAAAGTTIYTVQRKQLYRAFDETLMNSVNSLVLLIRPGPFRLWFDSEDLARLPAGQIRPGALFQIWSDRPIATAPQRPGPNPGFDDPPPPDPGPERRGLADPPLPGREPLPGLPPPRPLEEPDSRASRPSATVLRCPELGGADLPRLEGPPGQPHFVDISLPNGTRGRAVGWQFDVLAPAPGPRPRRPDAAKLTAVVAASTAELEKQLSFLSVLLAATALGTMTISGGVAWLVVSRGLYPLSMVARKIATLDETGLKQRLGAQSVPREIESVVQQLNGLLGRLDEAFERERALTADVAHELRTPVAEIRAIAEITLNRPRATDEYRQALGETREAVTALQALIERLLILARLEARQTRPELHAVALKPPLDQHWAQVSGHAEPRGITFEEQCPPNALVSADAKLLDVVLSNVLSNAVMYVPDRGRVIAEVRRSGSRCQLEIASTGCELSAAQVAKVFDRFWRADAARKGSGLNCGLGLTLVRRAMEAMGGTAEASVSADRRFVLTLTFDAVNDPA